MTDRHTDKTKNMTLPQVRWLAVMKQDHLQQLKLSYEVSLSLVCNGNTKLQDPTDREKKELPSGKYSIIQNSLQDTNIIGIVIE